MLDVFSTICMKEIEKEDVRELLEMAAKVAGISGEYSDTHKCFCISYGTR